jgi:hypothetical protein
LARRGIDPRPKKEQVLPQLSTNVSGQIGQARMDLVIQDGTQRMLIDVTIVSPYAGDASFRAACAKRDGYAARRAAIAKRSKYDSAELVPFAVETGGHLGTDARAFVKRLSEHAESPELELQYAYRALSVILQDGVARQLLQS